MLAQHLDEMRVAARVLVLLRLPGRPVAVDLGALLHRARGKHLGVLARDRAVFLDFFRIGARAVAAPIEWPTICALSILSASISAITSSRKTFWRYCSPFSGTSEGG